MVLPLTMAQDDEIARLARQIEAARKSEQLFLNADRVATVRRRGACELHRICVEFVGAVNGRLTESLLELSPPAYFPETFRDPGVNLFQISSQGRQMQIAFEAAPGLVSTEKFLVPYVLEGEVRTYNQKMLERFDIRTILLFYCVEESAATWRCFDWRTSRAAPLDGPLLAGLMGPLF
ncbi:MAG: hypothetical protein LAQ30_06320 [Acidobacteriia bacterium]|nr:hypothetical protein [Terriglobia bacterium]